MSAHRRGPPPRWVRHLIDPLLDRLGPVWILESDALDGLNHWYARTYWAEEYGLIERRKRGLWRRRWHIRLTMKGWAES